MCFSIPVKIISLRNKKIIVKEADNKKEVRGSLVKVKAGDYVILQNNFIIRKISKKEAKEIISLCDISSEARYKFNKKRREN